MDTGQQFEKEIIEKLDTLIKLVAVSSHAETILKGKSQKEQIKILSALGLSRNIIALIIGASPETVSVRLSEMKSKTKPLKREEHQDMKEKGDRLK